MHGHGQLGANGLGQSGRFRHVHGVATPAHRKERHVGVDRLELGEVVRVTGVVVGPSTQIKDVAHPVARLRVVVLPARLDVVGRHGLSGDPADLDGVSRLHRDHVAGHLVRHVLRREDLGLVLPDLLEVVHVEMVEVGVRDEDGVGGLGVGDAPGVDVDGDVVSLPPVGRLAIPRESFKHRVPP
jgi:hypothetical protein